MIVLKCAALLGVGDSELQTAKSLQSKINSSVQQIGKYLERKVG